MYLHGRHLVSNSSYGQGDLTPNVKQMMAASLEVKLHHCSFQISSTLLPSQPGSLLYGAGPG